MASLDELAAVWHIFEDPDVCIGDIEDQDTMGEMLKNSSQVYEGLPAFRKTGLKNAVMYIKTLSADLSLKELEVYVPEIYERTWGTEEGRETTSEIIEEELDYHKYALGIKFLLDIVHSGD